MRLTPYSGKIESSFLQGRYTKLAHYFFCLAPEKITMVMFALLL